MGAGRVQRRALAKLQAVPASPDAKREVLADQVREADLLSLKARSALGEIQFRIMQLEELRAAHAVALAKANAAMEASVKALAAHQGVDLKDGSWNFDVPTMSFERKGAQQAPQQPASQPPPEAPAPQALPEPAPEPPPAALAPKQGELLALPPQAA